MEELKELTDNSKNPDFRAILSCRLHSIAGYMGWLDPHAHAHSSCVYNRSTRKKIITIYGCVNVFLLIDLTIFVLCDDNDHV